MKKCKKRKFKRKIAKCILTILYFASTACIPIYVFQFTFFLKNNIIYAMTISFVAFIVMDIICSLLESLGESIVEKVASIRNKKLEEKEKVKKEKEEEISKLEKLLLEKNDYTEEIKWAKGENKNFKQTIKKREDDLPKEIVEKLKKVCDNMEEIIEVLKKDTEEYYPLRHTFKVYFPEFKKATYQFINIAEGNSLDEESTAEYSKLATEFNQYLEYIKSSINKQDKMSLNIQAKSLVRILEAERKKGET